VFRAPAAVGSALALGCCLRAGTAAGCDGGHWWGAKVEPALEMEPAPIAAGLTAVGVLGRAVFRVFF